MFSAQNLLIEEEEHDRLQESVDSLISVNADKHETLLVPHLPVAACIMKADYSK
jgi:hypothetical protein